MSKRVFVISDLHLGGEPPSDGKPGFQMCSRAGQQRLAAFIDFVTAQISSDRQVELVINGDFVDFLAEHPFSAFTVSDAAAEKKMEQIIEHADSVFAALSNFLTNRSGAQPGRLTVVMGNHDLELSLPGPRRRLLERLGGGIVDLIFDGQALRLGPVLIEHGNRYDDWNTVDQETLRLVRAEVSRGNAVEPPHLAGSQLVIDIVNQLKPSYSFVDLLKPETLHMAPLLALLDPKHLKHLTSLFWLWAGRDNVTRRTDRTPKDRRHISGSVSRGSQGEPGATPGITELPPLAHEALVAAYAVAGVPMQPRRTISAAVLKPWRLLSKQQRRARLTRFSEALRWLMRRWPDILDTAQESDEYRLPAMAALTGPGNYQAVLYGHTHLAKRIEIGSQKTYINTGTWAGLMFLPREAFSLSPSPEEERLLHQFADDLAEQRSDRWVRLLPTYAELELGEAQVRPQLKLFMSANSQIPVPATSLRRLGDELYGEIVL